MRNIVTDLGAGTAADLGQIHDLFTRADEFYCWYREALLNLKSNQDVPKPIEWVPISDH